VWLQLIKTLQRACCSGIGASLNAAECLASVVGPIAVRRRSHLQSDAYVKNTVWIMGAVDAVV
jgi:hypothetical protein